MAELKQHMNNKGRGQIMQTMSAYSAILPAPNLTGNIFVLYIVNMNANMHIPII